MAMAPARQQRARLGGTEIAAGRQELVVRGHDAYQCARHHRSSIDHETHTAWGFCNKHATITSCDIQCLRRPPPVRCKTTNSRARPMAWSPTTYTQRGVLGAAPRAGPTSDSAWEGGSISDTLRRSCCLRRPYEVTPHG